MCNWWGSVRHVQDQEVAIGPFKGQQQWLSGSQKKKNKTVGIYNSRTLRCVLSYFDINKITFIPLLFIYFL